MKKGFFLYLIITISFFRVQAQKAGQLSEQDSTRQVWEKRMARFEKQRQIYEKRFAENPKAAMDSVVMVKNQTYYSEGLKRLEHYQKNNRLDTLQEINLAYAGLKKIPDFVFDAKNLEVLILDNNHIKKLPRKLKQLPHLRFISWKENGLEDFWWVRIARNDQLEKLDLSHNTLSRLPAGVRNLKGLKELVFEENLIDELPVSRLRRARSIENVSFSRSHLLRLGEGEYGKLGFIKVFKANNCGLTTIDPSFYEMRGLEELQLQGNKLSVVPVGISALTNLKKLSLYKNEIRTLPKDMYNLNLVIMDLYYNHLEIIPEEIAFLNNLEVLFLAHNKIYSLPESLDQLEKLEELYLHHNRLSTLPASLASIKGLKVARVNDNYLTEFPKQFLKMHELKDLDISNNQISTIPEEVGQLSNLELFTYQKNPIDFNSKDNQHIPQMIIEMMEAGTTCVPRIYKEEVVEASDAD